MKAKHKDTGEIVEFEYMDRKYFQYKAIIDNTETFYMEKDFNELYEVVEEESADWKDVVRKRYATYVENSNARDLEYIFELIESTLQKERESTIQKEREDIVREVEKIETPNIYAVEGLIYQGYVSKKDIIKLIQNR